ncbi:unnamed protein product, partial [Ectocarpus fasciculatus]
MVIFGRGGWTRLAALCWLPMAFSSIGEVGDVTSVTVDASSYDERPLLEGGCYVDGCEPDLTRVSTVCVGGQFFLDHEPSDER